MPRIVQNGQESNAEDRGCAFSGMLEAVLWYAGQRIRVFPLHTVDTEGNCSCGKPDCASPGKHPLIKGWRGKATDNPYTLRYWWKVWPDANIGAPTGEGSVVVDFDDPEAYFTWCDEHPGLANTRTARTGGGGYHVWLSTTEPIRTYLHHGGEVRSGGAYVVLPPSRHASGGVYEWIDPEAKILTATAEQLPPRKTPEVTPADVDFTDAEVEPPDLSEWGLSDRILGLIYRPPAVGERSEADMSVIVALVAAGAADDQIRAVFRTYPIGAQGKYADKGEYADPYLAHSIGKARTYVRAKVNERPDARSGTQAKGPGLRPSSRKG